MGSPLKKPNGDSDFPIIPGYEILSELGQGANGVAYLADRNGSKYVIKFLKNETSDAHIIKYFRREAASLARLSGLGVAHLKEYNQVNDDHYIVMEYIAGRTLSEYVKSKKLENSDYIDLALQLSTLLDRFHTKGYVHGDLKPENIIVDNTNQLRLIDVGLATEVERLKNNESTFGSIRYASPEQLGVIQSPIDFRADLFSLGCLLYEVICGAPIIEKESVAAHLHALSKYIPTSPVERKSGVSPALAEIVKALLYLDPEDRPSSAEQVLQLLRDIEKIDGELTSGESFAKIILQKKQPRREPYGLIGRQDELEELTSSWRKTYDHNRGSFNLVRADSGMGKSRLINELLKQVEHDAIIIEAKCDSKKIMSFYSLRLMLDSFASIILEKNDADIARIKQMLNTPSSSFSHLIQLAPKLRNLLTTENTAGVELSKDQMIAVASDFLLHIGRELAPTLIYIDDTQWIDMDSLTVFSYLARAAKKNPLMVVFASRNESIYQDSISKTLSHIDAALSANIILRPLNNSEIYDLLKNISGAFKVPEDICLLISEKSGNNPFIAIHYLNLLIDDGALIPANGEWLCVNKDIKKLQLPNSIAELLLTRIDELEPTTVDLLKMAAILGSQFDIGVLQNLETNVGDLFSNIDKAVNEGLIQHLQNKQYAFTHDRVRDAVLSKLTPQELPVFNQNLADALVASKVSDFSRQCLVAKLYIEGDLTNKNKVLEYSKKAGLLCLKELALNEAKGFLENALKLHSQLAKTHDIQIFDSLAATYDKLGLTEEALKYYDLTLAHTHNPSDRALIRVKKAHVHLCTFDNILSWNECCAAFDEINEASPRANSLREITKTVLLGLGAVFIAITKIGYGTRNEKKKKRYEVIGQISEISMHVSFFISNVTMLQSTVRTFYYGLRAQDTKGISLCTLAVAIVTTAMGLKSIGFKLYNKAEKSVIHLSDQFLYAKYLSYKRFMLAASGDLRAADMFYDKHQELFEKWFTPSAYSQLVGLVQYDLFFRGLIAETKTLLESTKRRLDSTNQLSLIKNQFIHVRISPLLDAADGEYLKAKASIEDHYDLVKNKMLTRDDIDAALTSEILVAWMSSEKFKRSMSRQENKHDYSNIINVLTCNYFSKYIYIAFAHQKCDLAIQASENNQVQMSEFKKALDLLKMTSSTPPLPILQSHYYALNAAYYRLQGHTNRAIRELKQAEEIAFEINSPWILALVNKERSLIYSDQVRKERHYETATQFAHKYQLNKILKIEEKPKSLSSISTNSIISSATLLEGGTLKEHKNESYLRALLQVSLSSISVVDPQKIAKLVLAEIMNILGAERAIIFLKNDKTGAFDPAATQGYSSNGDEPQYSRTVLNKVINEGQTIIVGCNEQGEIIGSESITAQGIRSVICSELRVQDDIYGAVYLDSRIVRGVFKNEDATILQAMANQVAISIVTAKTAQVEIEKMEYEKDMSLLSTVQQMLLPAQNLKTVNGVKVAAFYKPAQSCGGDWWTCTDPIDNEFYVMLGDVSGHGAASAMVTSIVSSAFACMNKLEPDTQLKQKLKFMSNQLLDVSKNKYLMTMCSLEINTKTKTVKTIGAGAPEIILLKKSGEIKVLDTYGTPLGMSDFDVSETEFSYDTGDRIFLLTDGIIEHQLHGREIGFMQIYRMFANNKSMSFSECFNLFAEFIAEACSKQAANDDISYVLIEF